MCNGQVYCSRVTVVHATSPFSCGSSWFHGTWTDGCKECGGFPMERPCCICGGKCCAVWARNISMVGVLPCRAVSIVVGGLNASASNTLPAK